MIAKPRILVIGAGIGGLSAGLALRQRGFPVSIFDQAAQLAELGAGIQIAPNGARVLRALGLGTALESFGVKSAIVDLRLWNTGERWKMMEHGAKAADRYGAPHYTLHRADLQAALLAAVMEADPAALRLGQRCIGFEQSEKGVVAVLQSGERIAGDAVIGADGIHSVIRQGLFGPDRPSFTGFMAWRGLCPAAKLPPDLMRHGGWIAPASHIFHYPVRNRELLNLIAVVERGDWRHESWTDRGTHDEWLGDFPGWHADAQAMIAAVEQPFKWALMVREPLPRWSVGRASLLGDSCHSTLPFLAQGASMAIEDGSVLARCLEAFGDVETALTRYEAARRDRTAAIVQASLDQKDRLHGDSLHNPETARQHVDGKWNLARTEELYDRIYGYDALRVAL
ncbi:MAG: FAD-dependent monooxygenase [Stellaceae bacterium]